MKKVTFVKFTHKRENLKMFILHISRNVEKQFHRKSLRRDLLKLSFNKRLIKILFIIEQFSFVCIKRRILN